MINCSCSGRKCDGVCREKNLNRKRVMVDKHGIPLLKKCPAAYDVDSNGDEIRKEI